MTATNSLFLLALAYDFAARKHTDQRRKGARAEPYVNHLTEVALLLAEATEGNDPELIIAGVLHDTLEDTDTTFEELAETFGMRVAEIVLEVTDDKSLPKAERKRLQVEHAPHKSPQGKMLKIADKIANLRALRSSPPPDWPDSRVGEYFEWAAQVVNGCRGINPWLEKRFDEAFNQAPHK